MFQNREEAGVLLSRKLKSYKNNGEAIILAIPRGGVVVGKQLADSLHLPLSLLVVKKLGAPGNPELAIGAVASDGIKFIDKEMVLRLGIDKGYLDEESRRKIKEIEEREIRYQVTGIKQQIKDKRIVVLTDDGVATGATTKAAIKYIKQLSVVSHQNSVNNKKIKNNRQLILAVPVIAKDTYDELKREVDKLIALEVPEFFGAVGQFYREFGQVTDEEVIEILASRK